ncbi:MAG: hypothetical protein DRI90_28615 [Deltaproteobacteria bacterium]|nr:MAG: hypothetical protein DRI90_28615 [Deltaproteobacteria bacterium]
MITVGCAGFPVPATRYFKEFSFVEVQETHLSLPGRGTIRRWRREAPEGFRFALLGPRNVGQEGFRVGKVTETALESIEGVAEALQARTAVFVAPTEFNSTRTNKAVLKDFLTQVRERFDTVVFEPSDGWNLDECDDMAEEADAIVVRDPLVQELSKRKVAYYRLHGPAGHKSRYEDPAIERLSAIAAEAGHETATYVFTNVDMFADAKRFKKALKDG